MYELLFFGAPDRIRTCDTRLRKPVLYPAELRALIYPVLARISPRSEKYGLVAKNSVNQAAGLCSNVSDFRVFQCNFTCCDFPV